MPNPALLTVSAWQGCLLWSTRPMQRRSVLNSASCLGDDVTVLIADMAATTTLTLEGLQVLISAQKMAAQRGTGLRLAAARRNVLKFMDITGTRRLFSSHSSVEEARKRAGR